MAIAPGSRIGTYEVTAFIGAGGMGEVYQASDTKLGRDVATKVLPGDVAADAERLAQFRRKAELLASLNHPNIASIHGIHHEAGRYSSGSYKALCTTSVFSTSRMSRFTLPRAPRTATSMTARRIGPCTFLFGAMGRVPVL